MKHKSFVMLLVAVLLFACQSAAAQDWMSEARSALEQGKVSAAQTVVEKRLAEAPEDWDALGWHARIIARQGQWPAAESEYRRVLEHTPNDTDIVLGLADVLIWQGKNNEALRVLGHSSTDPAVRAELSRRRARVLTVLGRTTEARAEYRALLTLDPSDREAKSAIAEERSADVRRFELRIGNDTDRFNYTDTANAQSVMLRARWNSRFTTLVSGESYQRFGERPRKARVGGTVNLSRNDYLTIGGAIANRQDVISRYDQSVEYGHVFRFANGPVRGLEASVEQRSLWFTSSRVTLVRGTTLLYLPSDWMFSVSVTAARSAFESVGHSWSPSGSTRLYFPLGGHLRGNLLYAVGTEDFSNIDQIGRFAAQTYGGGVRFALTKHQDINVSGAYQRRTQGRTQTSLGVSYGIRF